MGKSIIYIVGENIDEQLKPFKISIEDNEYAKEFDITDEIICGYKRFGIDSLSFYNYCRKASTFEFITLNESKDLNYIQKKLDGYFTIDEHNNFISAHIRYNPNGRWNCYEITKDKYFLFPLKNNKGFSNSALKKEIDFEKMKVLNREIAALRVNNIYNYEKQWSRSIYPSSYSNIEIEYLKLWPMAVLMDGIWEQGPIHGTVAWYNDFFEIINSIEDEERITSVTII